MNTQHARAMKVAAMAQAKKYPYSKETPNCGAPEDAQLESNAWEIELPALMVI
eukprot:CAMPEP_0198558374 /NCGR_PEP_ID=MMETSP1462-20131121/90403_1 /TAXON_ID=1333877 /ORGANISM="Brandtodinium nutriculum, Strain RCC3387" /LENGTH=52 /DNA_ID=CAMNT_0044289193 /DNA_START=75 /DNA_END=233 /DNA_ORIENTATION=+